MGVELFLLLIIVVLALAGFFIFGGSFGAAKADSELGDEGRVKRPTHIHPGDDSATRFVGADTKDEIRKHAEQDPNTETRD